MEKDLFGNRDPHEAFVVSQVELNSDTLNVQFNGESYKMPVARLFREDRT
jgi:hypothetical protein